MEGCKRNQQVYQTIARELQTEGYERTFQQCREKIKKLKQEYNKIKDKLNKTGEAGKKYLKTWDFFDPLDEILGHKPATCPPVVVDSLVGIESGDEHEERTDSDTLELTDVMDKPGSLCSLRSETDRPGSSSLVDGNDSSEPSPKPLKMEHTTPVSSKKKRKRQFDALQGTMKEMVVKVVEAQKASDKMFLELEEKRMKMEEAQQERDMRNRREEREFQMRLFQMMCGAGVPYQTPMMPSSSVPMQYSQYPSSQSLIQYEPDDQ